MIKFPIPNKYLMSLDDITKNICINNVKKYGVDEAIEHQLNYLDCSRVKDGLRLMQTIGTPYCYEMSKLVFILDTYLSNDEDKIKVYFDRLKKLHKANIKYEEDNPPIIYDEKKKSRKASTTKKLQKETALKDIEKPKKVNTKTLRTDIRAAVLSNIKLTIK